MIKLQEIYENIDYLNKGYIKNKNLEIFMKIKHNTIEALYLEFIFNLV